MMIVAGFDLGEVESESPRLRSGCGGCCTPGTTAAAPDPTTNGTDKHRNGKETKLPLRNAQTCSAWLLIDVVPLKTINILSQNKSSPEVG